jgi:hypothetical protein
MTRLELLYHSLDSLGLPAQWYCYVDPAVD